MHRKLTFIIAVFALFSLLTLSPVYSEDVTLLDKTNVQENVVENTGEENPDIIKTTPKTAEMVEKSASWPYQNDLKDSVSPQPRQELFRVLISFMKVMLGVVICSIIIFLLALIAKKFYGVSNIQDAKNIPDNLKSPSNEDDALKNFLNKTQ